MANVSHLTAAFYAGIGQVTNKGTGQSNTPSQRTCVSARDPTPLWIARH